MERTNADAQHGVVGSWVSDIDDSVADAEVRLRRVPGQLREAVLTVRGEVGDQDPAQAVADAIHVFPADQIVLVHHPEGLERFKEHDLLTRLGAVFDGPIDSPQLDRAARVVAQP